MKTSSFFSGALSKANTAIAQARNAGVTDIATMEEKASFAIYPELLNIKTNELFASFVRCDLESVMPDSEIPMDMRTNVLVQICALVAKDALSLYKLEPTDSLYATARLVWASEEFKPSKQKVITKGDGGKAYKTEAELAAELEGEGDCAGGACKI